MPDSAGVTEYFESTGAIDAAYVALPLICALSGHGFRAREDIPGSVMLVEHNGNRLLIPYDSKTYQSTEAIVATVRAWIEMLHGID